MREVTLYHAVPERTMAGDVVEMHQWTGGDYARMKQIGPDECVETVEIIRCPVVPLCSEHKTEYLAFDPTIQRYFQGLQNSLEEARNGFRREMGEREKAESLAAYYKHQMNDARNRVYSAERATILQRIKAVFLGGRVLLDPIKKAGGQHE